MCQFSSMGKTYRPYLPEQDLLLPPSLRDWLPEGHLAYFVSDLIDELNLSAIESYYEQEERGYPPYHPRMMTKILVYGYCVGVFSSRRLQKRLHEDVAFRVLAANNQPDFRTLSDFRKVHLTTLQGLFEQVLRMAVELGALKLGRIAIDGSKLKANASKHKAMSYKRMKEEQKRLKQEVRRLLEEAERIDAEEDARYGRNSYGDELPAELQRREERLQRIREAKRALEARARQETETAAEEPDGEGSKTEVKPEEKDQYNFTDPESRILKGPDGFLQGYNAQIAVEPVLQLIVGQAVTQAANDKEQLLPMLATVEEQAGQKPPKYWPTVGIPLTPACKEWKKPKSMLILRWLAISTISELSGAHGERYPRGRRAPTACAGNCRPKSGEPFTRRGKRLWNRCSARSSKLGDFGSSCCAAWTKCRGNGLWSVWPTTF